MIIFLIISLLLLFQCNSSDVRPTSENEICLTSNDFADRFASYSPDGEWIVFESDRDSNWNIYLMDKDGEQVQRLTDNPNDDRRPSWHPSGKQILFESDRNGHFQLFTINVSNRNEKKLPIEIDSSELIFASYAPDGDYIAASLQEGENNSNLILIDSGGNFIKRLTNNHYRNFYPRWSNDGKKIVYFSRKETNNTDDEIYVLDLETGVDSRMTNWPKHNFCPSWSPDGRRIAYVTSMEGSRPEIYVMDSDGHNEKRITHNEDGETLPNWHPFESKILVTAYRNGNYQICQLVL